MRIHKTQTRGFGGSEGIATIVKYLCGWIASVGFPTNTCFPSVLRCLVQPSAPTSELCCSSLGQSVLKYKVYHILDANSLVSNPARGDPEDKCSFPEWFIMLRLHYLAFWVWENESPASFPWPLNFHLKVNIASNVWVELLGNDLV